MGIYSAADLGTGLKCECAGRTGWEAGVAPGCGPLRAGGVGPGLGG